MIKPPTGFSLRWNDFGTGTPQDCSIWYPVAPRGYVAVGCVANNTHKEPRLENYACLREDLVKPISRGTPEIWSDKGSHAGIDVTLYPVNNYPHTFRADTTYDPNTVDRNDFRLTMTGLSDFSFEVTGHDVSSGEWGGVTCVTDDTGATMTVRADRKGNDNDHELTAKWFKEALGGGSAIGTQTSSGLPNGLNFAFKGTLSFTHLGKRYHGWDIVIAQGHTGFERNNWWIGGPNMSEAIALPQSLFALASQPLERKLNDTFIPIALVLFALSDLNVSSMSMGIVPVPLPR